MSDKDTIYRQDAIDALWKALYEYEDRTEKQFQDSDELDVEDWILHRIFVQNMSDIDRQTIMDLPTAQRKRTDKHTETHACDSISRQAAIDALHMHLMYRMGTDSNKKRLDEWINNLPSAQPYTEEQLQKLQDLEQAQLEEAYRLGRESAHQWISCDERLPDPEAKIYWVCTDTGYQCQCRWTNINHFWTDLTVDWHWHIMDVSQYSKVVAWMSLPEPYKENKDERD